MCEHDWSEKHQSQQPRLGVGFSCWVRVDFGEYLSVEVSLFC
jgi:hypothetical protein